MAFLSLGLTLTLSFVLLAWACFSLASGLLVLASRPLVSIFSTLVTPDLILLRGAFSLVDLSSIGIS